MAICLFTEYAEADLLSIGEYIAKNNPARASSFVEELRARCNAIALFPKSGPLRPDMGRGIRLVTYRPYLILYSLKNDTVIIEGIIHGARDLTSLLH